MQIFIFFLYSFQKQMIHVHVPAKIYFVLKNVSVDIYARPVQVVFSVNCTFVISQSFPQVLCIVPINTILNWVAEFDMWLPDRQTNGVLATEETQPKKKSSARKAKTRVKHLSDGVQMQDSIDTTESNSLLGDGDSRGDNDSPLDGLRTNDDMSCDGPSSSSSKSSTTGKEEDISENVTYRQFPIFIMNDCHRTMAARHKIISK